MITLVTYRPVVSIEVHNFGTKGSDSSLSSYSFVSLKLDNLNFTAADIVLRCPRGILINTKDGPNGLCRHESDCNRHEKCLRCEYVRCIAGVCFCFNCPSGLSLQ